MKILTHGNKYKLLPTTQQIKCPECQCVFEIDSNDSKTIDFDTTNSTAYTAILCPECFVVIRI